VKRYAAVLNLVPVSMKANSTAVKAAGLVAATCNATKYFKVCLLAIQWPPTRMHATRYLGHGTVDLVESGI
jgi:hypothetical protein